MKSETTRLKLTFDDTNLYFKWRWQVYSYRHGIFDLAEDPKGWYPALTDLPKAIEGYCRTREKAMKKGLLALYRYRAQQRMEDFANTYTTVVY